MKNSILISLLLGTTTLINSCSFRNNSSLETEILRTDNISQQRPKAEILVERRQIPEIFGMADDTFGIFDKDIVFRQSHPDSIKRQKIIESAKDWFNPYIRGVNSQLKKGNLEKTIAIKISKKYRVKHYTPFLMDLKNIKPSSKDYFSLPELNLDILSSYKQKKYKEYMDKGLFFCTFPKIIDSKIIIPEPRFFSKFKKKNKKKNIFGIDMIYERVLARENLLDKLGDAKTVSSVMHGKFVVHDLESYEKLYETYLKKFAQPIPRNIYKKLELKYAKRVMADAIHLPEDQRKKIFVEEVLNFQEKSDLVFKLSSSLFNKLPESLNMKKEFEMLNLRWGVSYQFKTTSDVDLLRLWVIRKEMDPSLRHNVRLILQEEYECVNAQYFCNLSDSEIRLKTNKFYNKSFDSFNNFFRRLNSNKKKFKKKFEGPELDHNLQKLYPPKKIPSPKIDPIPKFKKLPLNDPFKMCSLEYLQNNA